MTSASTSPAMPASQPTPAVKPPREFHDLMDQPFKGSIGDLVNRPSAFDNLQRVARMFAESSMVPDSFKGKIADCAIAIQISMRLDTDVFMLMQSMHVIHGRPGFEAKFIIAMVNERGPFEGPIQYDFVQDEAGDIVACRAYATHKTTGQLCENVVTKQMVIAEGWWDKKGSKWPTMTRQMFAYRSAVFLSRIYCPEVILGFSMVEELRETGDTEAAGGRTESLVRRLGGPSVQDAGEELTDALNSLSEQVPEQQVGGDVLVSEPDAGDGDVAEAPLKSVPYEEAAAAMGSVANTVFDKTVASVVAEAGCDDATARAAVLGWLAETGVHPADLNTTEVRNRFKHSAPEENWKARAEALAATAA